MDVIKRIRKVTVRFPLSKKETSKDYHLVDWALVCKLEKEGGLVSAFAASWKIAEESQNPWQFILEANVEF